MSPSGGCSNVQMSIITLLCPTKGQVISCAGVNMTSQEYGSLYLDCFNLSQKNTWQKMAPFDMERTQFYSVMIEVVAYLVAIFNPYNGRPTMEVLGG